MLGCGYYSYGIFCARFWWFRWTGLGCTGSRYVQLLIPSWTYIRRACSLAKYALHFIRSPREVPRWWVLANSITPCSTSSLRGEGQCTWAPSMPVCVHLFSYSGGGVGSEGSRVQNPEPRLLCMLFKSEDLLDSTRCGWRLISTIYSLSPPSRFLKAPLTRLVVLASMHTILSKPFGVINCAVVKQPI